MRRTEHLGHRFHVVDPGRGGVPAAHLGLPGDDEAGYGALPRGGRDAHDDLAAQRLRVQLAFAGDDEVRGRHSGVQIDRVGNHTESGRDGRAEGEQAEAETPGRTRPRPVAQPDQAGPPLDEVGPPPQGVVQVEHRLSVRPLLRSVDRAGAVRAEQRVVDVGCGDDRHRQLTGREDLGQVDQAGSTTRKQVDRLRAQRRPEPGATVVGRRPAQPDDDAPHTRGRECYELADAVRRRHARVASVGCDQVESRGLGGFDVGAVLDDEHLGVDEVAQRPAHARMSTLAAEARLEGVEKAWSAVGKGQHVDVNIRDDVPPPGGDRGSSLAGGQRPAELVRRDKNSHDGILPRRYEELVEIVVRRLTTDDIDGAHGVQTRSFDDYDRQHGEKSAPWTEAAHSRQRQRFEHFLKHDPDGSWAAIAGNSVVGTALALRRDGLWGLSLLAVDPETQSRGIGRRLLDAALEYAADATTAVILSSADPRAMRAYARAGFDLHPQVSARGTVERSALPRLTRVRDGDESRAEWADAVDRVVRGAARGPDHAVLNSFADMFVIDDAGGRGYAYVRRGDARIATVAATDDNTAAELLWRCLAIEHDGQRGVEHINGEQQWAVRVALAARLCLEPAGPVCWRGRRPPPAYLASGAFL